MSKNHTPIYTIDKFTYLEQDKILIAGANDIDFHNTGKKFTIRNFKTNDWRVLYLATRRLNHFLFKSEDGIKCLILKDVNYV